VSRVFRTEGPLLESESHLYVERSEDRRVAGDIGRGTYVALMGPRQTGKTSLLLRLRRQLLEEGQIPIYLDLSPARDRACEGWYAYLQRMLRGQLQRMAKDVSVPEMCDQLDFEAGLQSISQELESRQKIVILLDEVGAVPHSVAELFFSTIRTIFQKREPFPEFGRYVFVMAGTFIPSELVRDPSISPFNIASRIYTSDAEKGKLAGLIENLERAGRWPSEVVIDRIYEWTEGHLYLTQRLCSELEKESGADLSLNRVDAAVEAMMSNRNIQHIYGELAEASQLKDILERILDGERPLRFNRASSVVAELALIGVIKPDAEGYCRIRNPVYRRALDNECADLEPDTVGELTRLEHRLFEYFSKNVNRTCTYYEIAERIWGQGSFAEYSIEDRIYQLVARLRRKLKTQPSNSLEIVTVRGRGYKPQRLS